MAQADTTTSQNIAVITGVSGGIGLALVHELISQGWLVFGCARRANKIAELNTQYPSKDVTNAPYFSVVDVTDISGIKTWSEMIISNYGTPKLLIANAGIGQSPTLIEDIDPNKFDLITNVNIGGSFALTRAFLPSMKKCNINSVIIGMSSGAGITGYKGLGAYCASKFGLEGFMQVLSNELDGTNICAFAYAPGVVATDMFQEINNLDSKGLEEYVMPTSQDVAKEFYPQIIEILKEPKKYNGIRQDTPILSSKKYADKLQAGFKAFSEHAMQALVNEKSVDEVKDNTDK